jgi:hypothetical protein
VLEKLFHAPYQFLSAWKKTVRQQREWSKTPGKCSICGGQCGTDDYQCRDCYEATLW